MSSVFYCLLLTPVGKKLILIDWLIAWIECNLSEYLRHTSSEKLEATAVPNLVKTVRNEDETNKKNQTHVQILDNETFCLAINQHKSCLLFLQSPRWWNHFFLCAASKICPLVRHLDHNYRTLLCMACDIAHCICFHTASKKIKINGNDVVTTSLWHYEKPIVLVAMVLSYNACPGCSVG